MARVTLPADHGERDFELARVIAERLELSELHVFWPPRAQPRPESPAPRGLLGLLSSLGAAFEWLGERLVAQSPSRTPRR